MNTPSVTILIDTYNYGCYIEEAVSSVLAQDFPAGEREILVVDDGSTDDTAERLKKFGDEIVYLRKENGGQASAFNHGMKSARGEIVAFLDGDDYWLPGKLSRIVEEFAAHPDVGMVYHKLRKLDVKRGIFEDGGLPLESGFIAASAKDLLSYVLYPTSFLAFRRSMLATLLPIPEELVIQADAYLSSLIVFVAPVVALPECLAVYRVHGQNLFASRGEVNRDRQELRLRTREALLNRVRIWLRNHGYDLRCWNLRALLKQWELSQEKDRFIIKPPGRLHICRHLMQYAHFFGPQLTSRHRAVTYMNAVGSLFVGYENVHRLDEWRVALKTALPRGTKQR